MSIKTTIQRQIIICTLLVTSYSIVSCTNAGKHKNRGGSDTLSTEGTQTSAPAETTAHSESEAADFTTILPIADSVISPDSSAIMRVFIASKLIRTENYKVAWDENKEGWTTYVHFLLPNGEPSTFALGAPRLQAFQHTDDPKFTFKVPGKPAGKNWYWNPLLYYKTAFMGTWVTEPHATGHSGQRGEGPSYEVWFSNGTPNKNRHDGTMPIIIDPHGKTWCIQDVVYHNGRHKCRLYLAPTVNNQCPPYDKNTARKLPEAYQGE